MKVIAVITEDFSLYYDLVKELKRANIPFISLSLKDEIPSNVGVVLTSKKEFQFIEFQKKIQVDDVKSAIDKAIKVISGKEWYNYLIIGIDPGERPGIAVVGDGRVVQMIQASKPEEVIEIVKSIVEFHSSKKLMLRIGHGAKTYRNRIINSLLKLKIPIEIVDETSTTKRVEMPDVQAAINIALSEGKLIKTRREIRPTEGELRHIQERSRIVSKGAVTISKELAEMVVRGELRIEEAIARQRGEVKGISLKEHYLIDER